MSLGMTRIDKTRGSGPFWYIRAIAQVEQFGEEIREARRWFEHVQRRHMDG